MIGSDFKNPKHLSGKAYFIIAFSVLAITFAPFAAGRPHKCLAGQGKS